MYRLYVDEVGNDDLTHVDRDELRYLSLTGVAMPINVARDELIPKFDWIKRTVFDHDPDNPLIFHRSDIVQRKKKFGVLNDDVKRALFDRSIMRVLEGTPYVVITAVVDKLGMMNQPNWQNQHPYHYLMEIMVEKYVQLLERKRSTGDIMPEGRKGKKDQLLQEAFEDVVKRGTYFVGSERMSARMHSTTLKIRYKPNNIAGLQLADLIAHPSLMLIRSKRGHPVTLGGFATRIGAILERQKYDRSYDGRVNGYGVKWFP